MKKNFLTAVLLFLVVIAAAVLVATVVSCGELFAPDLTEQGRANAAPAVTPITMSFNVVEASGGTVTLEYAPPVRASRALSLPLAKAATDFYEVVFHDGSGTGELYRRNFRDGQTIRMTVPDGNYNNVAGSNFAYMFAGRNDGKTLLAVGKIRHVLYKDDTYDDGTPGDFAIDDNAKIVTFELEPLETDLTGRHNNGYSFESWDNSNASHPPENYAYVQGKSVLSAKVNGQNVPVFTIPENKVTNGFIYVWSSYPNAVKAWPVGSNYKFFDTSGFFEQGVKAPMAKVTVDFQSSVDYENNPEAYEGTAALLFPITMDAEDKDGLAVFTYEIPVYNYSDAASESGGPAATQWFVRGGLSNNLYDLGPANDSQGGKIVLGIGDLSDIKIIGTPDDNDGFWIGGGYRPVAGGNPPQPPIPPPSGTSGLLYAQIGSAVRVVNIGDAAANISAAGGALVIPAAFSVANAAAANSGDGAWEGYPVTQISSDAFANQTVITSVYIPADVTLIGTNTFLNCTNLSVFEVAPENTTYASEGGIVYDKAKTETKEIPRALTGYVNLAATLGSIKDSSFQGRTGITGVTIPASVTMVGQLCFDGCTNLTSVTFEGVINTSWAWPSAYANAFLGDLRAKYVSGGVGTYTTSAPASSGSVWTK